MKFVSSSGRIYSVERIETNRSKTVFYLKWRRSKLTIMRYNCCSNYFVLFGDGNRERVKIRKLFPDWWWRS